MSPHILSVHVMDRSAIHPTQCIQSATKYAVHWPKGGQYPSETKVTAATSDTLQLHAAVTVHAPGKYAVVQLRSWLVHCSACVKAAQHAAIPRRFP